MKLKIMQPIAGIGFQFAAKQVVDTDQDQSPMSANDWERCVARGICQLIEDDGAKAPKRRTTRRKNKDEGAEE